MSYREISIPENLQSVGLRAFTGDSSPSSLPGFHLLLMMGLTSSDGGDTELSVFLVDGALTAIAEGGSDIPPTDKMISDLMDDVRQFALTRFFEGIKPSRWVDDAGKPVKRSKGARRGRA